MNNSKQDYPHPPHYWKDFNSKDVYKPPDLKKIVQKDKVFFTFNLMDKIDLSFWEDGEILFPNYFDPASENNKQRPVRDLVSDKPLTKET